MISDTVRRDLPSGTVTFLFTDVEGSTKLLHELGAVAYAANLAEHRRVVRETCTARGGVEVDTQGDAFFVAFPTASDALEAARTITERLASGLIALRIGLHTGTPLLTEEGYVGGDVHFAARLAASAHGGQVVLSRATRPFLDERYSIVELGEHRFKDIPEPVAIFQLGDGQFPPLKTISNTNLPRPASSFVGRERELFQLLARIEEGRRFVTLTGPGGSGKTRLALEAAATLVPQFKAGVFWVGLAALRDVTLVTETIRQTLGGKDGLAEHIGEREMLLLLDNLEQVIEAAPELSALLASCPNLALLVTSRELLRVQGEVEYPVPPLAEAEAVSLFCERAQIAASDEIAELCRRLDSLPLAVELAAARAKALSPAQILERLSQRLDLLKGGRDAEPRQQTLRATIEWSYELLSEDEQQLFARLAVFAGGCTHDAAEEVAEAELDTLQSLVEKSLVRFSNQRYWMLETIREFAAERLEDSGERNELRARHAEWVLALARDLAAPLRHGGSDALERIAPERDNIRATLAWSAGAGDPRIGLELVGRLCVLWVMTGLVAEGVTAAERALAAGASLSGPERLPGLIGASEVLRFAGDYERAITLYEEALPLLADLDEQSVVPVWHGQARDEAIISVLKDLASTLAEVNDFDHARTRAEEALTRADALGDPTLVAHSLSTKALVEFLGGRIEEAQALYAAALPMWDSLDWPPDRALVHLMLGECARRQGLVDEAVEKLRFALELAVPIGHVAMVQEICQELAAVALLRDRAELGARLLGASERLREAMGSALWDPSDFKHTVESLRRSLGGEAFEEARAAGRALTDEEALALARTID